VPDVDVVIEDLISRTKGKYITQGVAFNKDCPRQMALLRQALSESASFSGLVKEMLALRYSQPTQKTQTPTFSPTPISVPVPVVETETSLKEVASAWVE
jgi:hypothetical protein